MNMKQNIIAVTLAIIVPVSAFALGGNISSPQLQFPDGAKHETIVKLLDYLRNDLMFIEGSFINEFTSQGFSGSARKATGLIQLLQQSDFELTVQFADLKDDRIALRLSQDSRRRETTLVINTMSAGGPNQPRPGEIDPARKRGGLRIPSQTNPRKVLIGACLRRNSQLRQDQRVAGSISPIGGRL